MPTAQLRAPTLNRNFVGLDFFFVDIAFGVLLLSYTLEPVIKDIRKKSAPQNRSIRIA